MPVSVTRREAMFGDGFEQTTPGAWGGIYDEIQGVGRVYLLSTMIALAALNTPSQRIARAQIPEAPGSFSDSDGGALSDDAEELR